jgi:hypothetical protein
MADGVIRLTYQGTRHEVDLGKLTFGEGRALERVTGKSITELVKPDLTAMQAIVWVALKRANPALQFSDLDNMAMSDLDLESEDEPEVELANPTEPAAE